MTGGVTGALLGSAPGVVVVPGGVVGPVVPSGVVAAANTVMDWVPARAEGHGFSSVVKTMCCWLSSMRLGDATGNRARSHRAQAEVPTQPETRSTGHSLSQFMPINQSTLRHAQGLQGTECAQGVGRGPTGLAPGPAAMLAAAAAAAPAPAPVHPTTTLSAY